jgi:hypothetical protein
MREPGEATATQVGCYRSSMPMPAPITLTVSARRRRATPPASPVTAPPQPNHATIVESPGERVLLVERAPTSPLVVLTRPTLRPCARGLQPHQFSRARRMTTHARSGRGGTRTCSAAWCGAAEAAHGRCWGGSRFAEWALPRIRTGAAYTPSLTLPVAGCLGDSDSQQLVPRQQRPQQAPWRWAVEVDANSTT